MALQRQRLVNLISMRNLVALDEGTADAAGAAHKGATSSGGFSSADSEDDAPPADGYPGSTSSGSGGSVEAAAGGPPARSSAAAEAGGGDVDWQAALLAYAQLGEGKPPGSHARRGGRKGKAAAGAENRAPEQESLGSSPGAASGCSGSAPPPAAGAEPALLARPLRPRQALAALLRQPPAYEACSGLGTGEAWAPLYSSWARQQQQQQRQQPEHVFFGHDARR